MTLEQIRRMKIAARELLRLQSRGHDVDPLSVEWATTVLRSRVVGPPPQKGYQADRIYDAMQGHPPMGMLAADIRERTGLAASVCAQTLCYMAAHGQVHMIRIVTRSRFFLTKALLETGRPLVEADEAARRAAKVKPMRPPPAPRPPRPAKPLPAHARPTTQQPHHGARSAPALIVPREQGVYREDSLPPGVRIEHLPGVRDRYEVLPPVVGIGAVADWQKRTQRGRK